MLRFSPTSLTILLLALSQINANPGGNKGGKKKPPHIESCGQNVNSLCTTNDDCRSEICEYDVFGQGVICEPGALGARCLNNGDCVASSCSFAGSDKSCCKSANGTVVEQGICQKGTHFCYLDSDCVDGCECFPLSTSSNYGYCYCD